MALKLIILFLDLFFLRIVFGRLTDLITLLSSLIDLLSSLHLQMLMGLDDFLLAQLILCDFSLDSSHHFGMILGIYFLRGIDWLLMFIVNYLRVRWRRHQWSSFPWPPNWEDEKSYIYRSPHHIDPSTTESTDKSELIRQYWCNDLYPFLR